MIKRIIGGGILAVLAASPAFAGAVSQSQLTDGLSLVNIPGDGGVDVSAQPRAFKHKTVNSVTAVGVAGGSVDGEIDGAESIDFAFLSGGVKVKKLSIAFLYAAGNFGDNPGEVAKFSTSAGDFLLTVTGTTSATWTGLGTAVNSSIASEAGGGKWTITGDDIFGECIDSLRLMSGNVGTSKKADFSFVCLEFEQCKAVPLPSAAGMGLAGLGLVGGLRRRRAG
jgi:hypothetical protein